ncbi:MAG: hypothetical protein D6687_09370 [Acidobacteria bacterium]|jgi:phage I-like protein|nr:MAG: hypothetical protein D6687_09370 [Acidobacteriota bacterium]BCW95095.1 MAG: hypothetical protein KatS3mg018_0577 [Fimbriimonadales bacterium]
MTARILAYNHNGKPSYLPNYDGLPILVSEVGRSILDNYQAGRNPQTPDLREGHWGMRAVGWLRNLREDDEGLYAEFELTPEGETLVVQQRAYGYVSPGLAYNLRLPSGEAIEGWSLLHVALTNDPAQYGAAAIMLSREDAITLYAPPIPIQEESTMTQDHLTAALQPILQRLEQMEQHIVRLTSEAQQRETERTIESLQREIESWRYDGDHAIPPAVARQFAAMLARMPEPDRTDALNSLRNNPVALVKLSQSAQPKPAQQTEIDPATRKYLTQLGVSEETYLKYNRKEGV